MSSPATTAKNAKASRRTSARTFRIYKDQLEFIEETNSDCASFFVRFLLDTWMNNKVPKELKEEYYKLRQDMRHRANIERLKQVIKKNTI